MTEVRRRWRDYQTASGARPVKKFLMAIPDQDRAAVADGMREVREKGERDGGARHLRGEIWEVRVSTPDLAYRVLFASVGSRGRVLLSLEAFAKKTQRTPPATIAVAETRLRDWQERGRDDS